MHVTLRQLYVFEAVARHLSYSRAAEELHLTQPAVSMQIKHLEDTAGLPLLEQIGRRIHLTDAGRRLQSTCREVFESLDRYEMELSDLKGLKRGVLRLGILTTAKYFAPRILGPFTRRHPGVDVSLEVTNREGLLARLRDNLDDLYIFGQPPEGLDVEAEAFLENPLVVLAPRDHPLTGQRGIRLERLAEEPFLMREPGSGTRAAAERLFSAHGLTPRVRMELGSNETIKQAVAGGLGVSVLSRHTLALAGESNPIVELDVEGFPIRRYWNLVYPKGKELSVVARAFVDYVHKEVKDLPAESRNEERGTRN